MALDMENANKITAILAIGSLIGLMLTGGASFFIFPHYKEGVELAQSVFKDGFLFAIGVKAGLSVPKSSS
jgi:hypothetical protein